MQTTGEGRVRSIPVRWALPFSTDGRAHAFSRIHVEEKKKTFPGEGSRKYFLSKAERPLFKVSNYLKIKELASRLAWSHVC